MVVMLWSQKVMLVNFFPCQIVCDEPWRMVATAALSCRHLPWPLVWLVVTLIFLTLLRPICLRFLLCPCLSFCRSCPSCMTGCCIASPHAAASPAKASCCAVASRSASLPPLVRLVVALILLTPPHPIWRWITWGHRLLLSPCRCLWFLCSRASCPAGSCCVASHHATAFCASTPLVRDSTWHCLLLLPPPYPSRTTLPSPPRRGQVQVDDMQSLGNTCCWRAKEPVVGQL